MLCSIRGEAIVLCDGPISSTVTHEVSLPESREDSANTPPLDPSRLVDFRLRECLIAVLSEELKNTVGLCPLVYIEGVVRAILEPIDADWHT